MLYTENVLLLATGVEIYGIPLLCVEKNTHRGNGFPGLGILFV